MKWGRGGEETPSSFGTADKNPERKYIFLWLFLPVHFFFLGKSMEKERKGMTRVNLILVFPVYITSELQEKQNKTQQKDDLWD